jgi:flavin reductase (DIM6/NTAB) family NADH-FMN oxidoreductase RutF
MSVDAQRFRDLFSCFPSVVSIVTTLDGTGRPRGFTCNAVSAVSIDPALLLVCVDKGSSTLPAITETGGYVVNLLADGAEPASRAFAASGVDRFAGLDWSPSAAAGGWPVLHDLTVAWAECVLEQRIEAGDHWILIGRVEDAAVYDRPPLLYFQRSYLPWMHDEMQDEMHDEPAEVLR